LPDRFQGGGGGADGGQDAGRTGRRNGVPVAGLRTSVGLATARCLPASTTARQVSATGGGDGFRRRHHALPGTNQSA